MSAGSKNLKSILTQLYKETPIIEEYHVGESLRLDFYLPKVRLGFEFHGRQHREFVEHFHGDNSGFRASQYRDSRKIEIAQSLGIGVVVVWFDEELTSELVHERAIAALLPPVQVKKEKSEWHKKQLEKARLARRESYLRSKALKKGST